MTLTDPKPGGWANEETLTSDQMDDIVAELIKAVDGVNGGTYALQSDLVFEGPAAVHFAGDVEVEDTGSIFFSALSSLTFQGTVTFGGTSTVNYNSGSDTTFLSGALLDIESGVALTAALDTGSSVAFETGSDLTLEAGVNFLVQELADLDVDDDTISYQIVLSAADIEESSNEHTWSLSDANGPGLWVQQLVAPASGAQIHFPLRIPAGDTINRFSVVLNGGVGGGHAVLPTLPEFTLVEVNSGGASDIATAQENSANLAAYEVAHAFQVDNTSTSGALPYTVLGGRHYYLRVNGERGANAENAELAIIQISVEVVRRRLVNISSL